MKIFNTVGNVVAAGLMMFFAVPKLMGAEKSVAGFEQFKSIVPLNPNVFMKFTGIVELLVAILLILYTFNNKDNLGKSAYFLLLSTMIGGLIMEFFARPKPEMMLVIIAIALSVLSIYRLIELLQKNNTPQ